MGATIRRAAAANLAVRFLVELGAYASLGCWGAATGSTWPVRAALGALAPIAVMLVWARYLSPRAPRRLSDPAALIAELAIFAAAAAALSACGQPELAAAFAVLAAVNTVLVRVFARRAPGAVAGPGSLVP